MFAECLYSRDTKIAHIEYEVLIDLHLTTRRHIKLPLYSGEAWSITSDIKRRLESCEMWFLRKVMKIPWTDINEEVLSRAQVKRKLMDDVRVRQLNFLGHILVGWKTWLCGYDRKDRGEEE